MTRRLATLALAMGLGVTACGQGPASQKGVAKQTGVDRSQPVEAEVGDDNVKFAVLRGDVLNRQLAEDRVSSTRKGEGVSILRSLSQIEMPAAAPVLSAIAAESEIKDDGLYVGFPFGLLGEGHIFGGVFTGVSDATSEALGRLKLTDLPPIHVRPYVAGSDGKGYSLVLMGCPADCQESSEQMGLIALPIVGVDQENQRFFVDIAKVGEELSLIGLLDPDGAYTGLKEEKSEATFVDYSLATLVFDVVSTMQPIEKEEGAEAGDPVKITARWYLKLESGLNSAFTARPAAPGVGFFTTQRAAETKINRFATTTFTGEAPIHYYLKGIPSEFQPSFEKALASWNDVFRSTIGRELLSWEFIAEDDARSAQLVAGDIRYNIIEWDVLNRAPYGGLGPSFASQTTGEIFSASVLVQGPHIVEVYKKWFAVNDEANDLKASGEDERAAALLAKARAELSRELDRGANLPAVTASLNGRLPLRVTSQMAALEDPAFERADFFETPAGETYESYMKGYWQELVAHEVGHNLGLRHNFRGNLGSSDTRPSHSVMEYLGRTVRHKNRISEYDRMAIAYGYRGTAPTRTDLYCTDEDVPSLEEPFKSAECSRDDASADPYGNFKATLRRALDLAVAPASTDAPTWVFADMAKDVEAALAGAVFYATSARATFSTWTNWQGAGGARPVAAELIASFVATDLRSLLCDASLDSAAAGKATEAGRELATANLKELRSKADKIAVTVGMGNALSCSPSDAAAH